MAQGVTFCNWRSISQVLYQKVLEAIDGTDDQAQEDGKQWIHKLLV